jgi:hypothetical protein
MLAINAKVYRNTATWGTPTWVEVPELENVSVDPRYVESASNSRDSPFERIAATMVVVSVSARLKSKPGNTNYEALMDAFALRTVVDLLILDAASTTVGARGIRGDCYLTAAGSDQSITNRLYQALEIRLADTDNLPKFAAVATGPVLEYAVPGGSFA